MKTNISGLNRMVRSIIGAVAIAVAFFVFPQLNFWILGLGVILIITGLIGFCPIDYYFHMKQHR